MYGPVSRGHTYWPACHGTVKSRRAATALSLALAGASSGSNPRSPVRGPASTV
jgi:hypothetical protein